MAIFILWVSLSAVAGIIAREQGPVRLRLLPDLDLFLTAVRPLARVRLTCEAGRAHRFGGHLTRKQ
jgi:hypothetical protein